ncbi:uncharacterized protein LOC116033089 [Ipomoea triloba]|uniref:uncharacterized protein LOC116033089 n=1 Tax=Ipomoea triloba TaxID=35885 RepID=UPI00125E7DCF|nr:uncharacterized protein LOC116033089 [Ipomoea triloba]
MASLSGMANGSILKHMDEPPPPDDRAYYGYPPHGGDPYYPLPQRYPPPPYYPSYAFQYLPPYHYPLPSPSPYYDERDTLAKMMEMLQMQGEMDAHAIKLRSGKALPEATPPPKKTTTNEEPRTELNSPGVKRDEPSKDKEDEEEETLIQPPKKRKEVVQDPPPITKARLPFAQCFQTDVDNAKYDKFLQILRQLHIDMLFIDALGEMPRHAKFLKDLLFNKKKLVECSSQRRLNLGTLKFTRMCIQLADRSTKYPRGIVEDVLVRVDMFIFLVDFVILDMDPDVEVLLILGRPFLATARALIDVGEGKVVI